MLPIELALLQLSLLRLLRATVRKQFSPVPELPSLSQTVTDCYEADESSEFREVVSRHSSSTLDSCLEQHYLSYGEDTVLTFNFPSKEVFAVTGRRSLVQSGHRESFSGTKLFPSQLVQEWPCVLLKPVSGTVKQCTEKYQWWRRRVGCSSEYRRETTEE